MCALPNPEGFRLHFLLFIWPSGQYQPKHLQDLTHISYSLLKIQPEGGRSLGRVTTVAERGGSSLDTSNVNSWPRITISGEASPRRTMRHEEHNVFAQRYKPDKFKTNILLRFFFRKPISYHSPSPHLTRGLLSRFAAGGTDHCPKHR